ncbi:MAG: Arm DNA-binding domain-containing protein [Rhodospirillaceae bacterium]|nr:Arm DNA-binding domain-containing protein [Rhodospirillaceae bacterium]
MVKLRNNRISRRTVDAIAVERDTVFWDRELQGFGVRVYPSGRKVYIVQTRARGDAKKRITIGRYEDLSPSETRRRAAAVIGRIKSGKEPATHTRRRS